ncbi:hypothetical protein CYQ88_05840 [Hydrogenovibrio sp. SC-1]|uniref:ubiquinone biosynthesis accessory factor UbiJ n=1 Tax=Hydrogenovibrio sp. SC-1 TaxID=2065820 RepID=UPI000C7DD8AB|nr:hypothetical protein [Hydrogenovibrio sp. SC-1]PLA74403.1 hypothetical protein CYQ88_05840 [Hydrogenovibrio sp. SC-1]
MKTPSDTTENAPGLARNLLAKGIETLLNQTLKLDEDASEAFAPCDEKVIQLTFTDFEITFFIIYQLTSSDSESTEPEILSQGSFTVQSHLLGAPDAHLQMTVADFLQGPDAVKSFGDKALATEFLQALKGLEIDWEEQLSKLTGDLIAFKVGSTVRRGQKHLNAAQQKIADTLKEYLQFEVELLPTPSQVKRFNQQVTETTDAVDALAERIKALTADQTPSETSQKP